MSQKDISSSCTPVITVVKTIICVALALVFSGCASHHEGLPYWAEWSDLERETINAFPLSDRGEDRLTLHSPELIRGDHGDTVLLRMKGVVVANESHRDVARFDVRVNMRMDYYPDTELVRFVHYENFQFDFTEGSDAHRNEIMDQAARIVVRRLHDQGISPVGVERPLEHRPNWRRHRP